MAAVPRVSAGAMSARERNPYYRGVGKGPAVGRLAKRLQLRAAAFLDGEEDIDCRVGQGLPCRYAAESPEYSPDDRVLLLSGIVVKQLRGPAPNQKRVLKAFQELGWLKRIDDPIPPHDSVDVKECLHSTIEALNKHQQNRLIRFSGDGTGKGVCWAILPKAARARAKQGAMASAAVDSRSSYSAPLGVPARRC